MNVPDLLEVACATDDAYAPHCATMLHSLLAHHEPSRLRVHVLHQAALSPDSRARLRQLVEGSGAALNWLEVSEPQLRGFPRTRFNVACWYRVLLPELLPGVPRVLYLDSDMIVRDDLRPLWCTDLQDRLFAAVVNPLYPFMPHRWRLLGLAAPAEYLNSGVLLMDLDRMRGTNVVEHLRAYARAHPQNPWPEQDALAVVCRGQWLAVPPRWNAQNTVFDLRPQQLPYALEDAVQARQAPAIIHFIGPAKPWHYLCRHPLRHAYAEHRRRTPWPRLELEGRTWRNRLLRPLSLHRQVQLQGIYRDLVHRWRQWGLRGPRVMKSFARFYPEAVFVQLGSNDGAKHDPLRAAFLRSRWSGVMVEPVPFVFERLRANYGGNPRVRLENVAVATRSGFMPFHYLAQADAEHDLPDWYDELGSFRRDVILKHVDRVPDLERRIVTMDVPCVTLLELCRRNGIAAVDLLHTDLEGYDYEVIRSIDFAQLRPTLLVYEHWHLSGEDRARCRDGLRSAGYACFEERADTWCADTRVRDARHARFLRCFERIAAGASR